MMRGCRDIETKLIEALEDIATRLCDLPLACRTPEEHLNELVDWITKDILPTCEQAIHYRFATLLLPS